MAGFSHQTVSAESLSPGLRQSQEAMAKDWPEFEFKLLRYGSIIVGSWRGWVQPIRRTDGLFELLDDLSHDRDVYLVGEELCHLPQCGADHCRHEWMDKIADLRKPFELEIWQDMSQGPPRCWVLSPVILTTKHMWWDWSICDSLASEVWLLGKQTVVSVIPDYLIWLVKWMVYDQTGEWIGTEHNNTPEYHLKIVDPSTPCWCRSGESYRKCHREKDKRISKIRRGGESNGQEYPCNPQERRLMGR